MDFIYTSRQLRWKFSAPLPLPHAPVLNFLSHHGLHWWPTDLYWAAHATKVLVLCWGGGMPLTHKQCHFLYLSLHLSLFPKDKQWCCPNTSFCTHPGVSIITDGSCISNKLIYKQESLEMFSDIQSRGHFSSNYTSVQAHTIYPCLSTPSWRASDHHHDPADKLVALDRRAILWLLWARRQSQGSMRTFAD